MPVDPKKDCYLRKLPDEPHFTLLARDPSASRLLRVWASARRPTEPDAADEVDKLANEFDAWRRANMGRWRT